MKNNPITAAYLRDHSKSVLAIRMPVTKRQAPGFYYAKVKSSGAFLSCAATAMRLTEKRCVTARNIIKEVWA